MALQDSKSFTWSKPNYIISSDQRLLNIESIRSVLASSISYWTPDTPMNMDELTKMLRNSFCLGVYYLTEASRQITEDEANRLQSGEDKPLLQVGLARWVTDYTTFAYLTDVYILPTHERRGLGGWLNRCSDEWLNTLPSLRSIWKSEKLPKPT